ncbi:MAG: glycoside hydrolase family 15 protein [Candidatus Hydrothermarchaeota archaeon]
MTRKLVVGNGNLFINYDDDLNIRDLYFPHVGMENHVDGNRCRFGIWVDGKFSWLMNGWGERSLKYLEDSMVTDAWARNNDLGIELRVNDGVHYSKNIFLRKVVVKNLRGGEREVRLFFGQDFRLYGMNVGDTACYDPAVGSIVHYKKKRYFLINGRAGKEGIYQYSTGWAGFAGAEGTWRDAEDGVLSNNPIAQGSVDSTVSFRIRVPAWGEREVYYWIAAGMDFMEVKRLNEEVLRSDPAKLLREIDTYHKAWLSAGTKMQGLNFKDLPEKVVRMFKRSLLIIRAHIDGDGAVIAANDSDVTQFNRDHYSYMWPRDGALVAYALDKAGYSVETRKFFEFCSRIMTKRGFFLHKYNPDGTFASSWHPWIGSDGKPQLPIQEDGTAFIVFSLWHHYYQFKDIEFVKTLYEPLVKKAVDFMIRYRHPELKLPLPSYDLWEERIGTFTFTSSAVYAGIAAAWNFANLFGDYELAESYKKAALEVRDGVWNLLYDEGLGRFVRGINVDAQGKIIKDPTIDSSLYSVFYFCALPADDPRIEGTMKAIERRLWCKTKVGGVARYENDHYRKISWDVENVPGNPWFICTLWLAEWYVARAKELKDLRRAVEVLEWVTDHAAESGILGEQLNPYTSEPISVSPLAWSHATFVIAVLEYLEKYKGLESG